MVHQRVEEDRVRLLDAAEHALAPVLVQRGEAGVTGGARRVLDRGEPARQERVDLGRSRGDRQHVIERDRPRSREPGARRHESVEHHREEIAPRGQRHERLRMIPSAM